MTKLNDSGRFNVNPIYVADFSTKDNETSSFPVVLVALVVLGVVGAVAFLLRGKLA